MKLALAAAALGFPLVGAATDSPNVGATLLAYGVAAPFALLCWDQLRRAQKREAELEARIAELQKEAVGRERDLASRVGPMLYDSALLYRQGNTALAEGLAKSQSPMEVHALIEKMQTLVERMEGK